MKEDEKIIWKEGKEGRWLAFVDPERVGNYGEELRAGEKTK